MKYSKIIFVLLFFCCFINTGCLKTDNYAEFIKLKQLAENGDSKAQCRLGYMYYKGVGVKQDYQKTFEYYTKSADNGNTMSLHNIGVIYENGIGLKSSTKKACEKFRRLFI